jgi:ribosomal protein S18 acetylase RimI-like enzyme
LEKGDKTPIMELIASTTMFSPQEEVVAGELLDDYLNQPDHGGYDIRVLEDDRGGIAGYVCFGLRPMTEGTFDVYWIAVHSKHQRKGYGKVLLEALEKAVKEKKGRLIVIETSSKSKYTPTRQFYLGMGYEEAALIRDFYKPGDDLVIYSKYLCSREE